MKRTKPAASTFPALILLSMLSISIPGEAAAADIDWHKYMQSAANVSAIAAAVAMVDDCSKKLVIEETVSEASVRLSFMCNGTEDEEAAAFIEFHKFGDDVLVPKKFEFAG
ncbi:MAG: hypothetical protein ACR2PM_18615 [Hyphomicrobiales bacterium]